MASRGRMPFIPALLQETQFRRYWAGATISLFGDRITALALPLVAITTLHVSATQMGALTAAGLLPTLVLSVPFGVLVDRSRRRRHLMIAADLLRALLVATIPLAFLLNRLSLGDLYTVALLVGSLSLLFGLAQNSVYPALVPKETYVDANSLLQGSRAFSFLAGPSIGGFLVQILSAPFAVLVDSLSYLFSAASLARIAPQEPEPAPREAGGALAGLGFLWRSRILRPALLAVATINLFNYVFGALFLLYASRMLHLSPATIGLILGLGATGTITGALVSGRISRKLGVGRMLVLGTLLFPAPLLLVPLAGGSHAAVIGLLLLAELGSGFGVMLLDVAFGALWTASLPDAIRARVNAALSLINYGIRPIGALIGGALPTFIGLHATIWVGTAGALLGCLWLLPSPIPAIRGLETVAAPASVQD